MKKIVLNRECQNGPIIMIFTEGTILKPLSRLTLYQHSSYIPIGNVVNKLKQWQEQGANIIYCTSRKKKQAEDMAELLLKYRFPGNHLVARESKEKYKDLVEKIVPDILIEDDCKSIGGAWQMCITKVSPEIKSKIQSIIVPEFRGIDHLPEDLEQLKKEKKQMAKTYEDFLTGVAEEDMEFVKELNELFLANQCKIEVKEAKRGYMVSYAYTSNKKRISLMNYVFRSQGMLVRIYARNVHFYDRMLDSIPDGMKKDIQKGGDCKRLNGISECSPTCTAGYDFMMDKVNYKKCKNSAFFWKVCKENNPYIKEMIENELKYIDVE